MINHLIVGKTKKITLDRMSYFREPYTGSTNKMKFEVYLSNNATKSEFKKAQQSLIFRNSLNRLT